MDDEKIFGRTFFEISFGRAVSLGCLVDYKVIILTVPAKVARDYVHPDDGDPDVLPVSHAAKVIGCWRSLSKIDLAAENSVGDDLEPMRRAVAFAQRISPEPGAYSAAHPRTSSRQFAAQFGKTVESYADGQRKEAEARKKVITPEQEKLLDFSCEALDIDGGMNAVEKQSRLDWLRAEPDENTCRILFNVRCLSEGVDVPSLDAVIFLSPRKSQVDIVQTVGRVMRTAKGKKRGYVIIPLVIADDKSPEDALERNEEFKTVWQVLNALKSIDPNSVLVDGTLQKVSDKIEIIAVQNGSILGKGRKGAGGHRPGRGRKRVDSGQGELMFDHDEILEENIRAKLVRHVGNRREWADWAGEVGEICRAQGENIRKALDPSDPANAESIRKFRRFKAEIARALNDNADDDVVIDMLSQHIVIRPVISALFSDYPFAEKNPISSAMTAMLEALDSTGYILATDRLNDFYSDVKRRCSSIKTLDDRQKIVVELFNSFFKLAFPKQQEKFGIVYTPIPIVDFIDHSVCDILQKEFGESLADDNVHILDPFTGTGTFITRLMKLIPKDRLPYKYWHELHAHEIMPLAYYIAAINIESEFYALCPEESLKGYQPNRIAVWTDTFAGRKKSDADIFTTDLIDNQKRIDSENDLPVRVIIGNPPYSVGQKSQNDDNQNDSYPELDARIKDTYISSSASKGLKNSLYDSYIRAYRWASDRIGNRGVIGFVTNAGWLDSASADGMRKCMEEEFSSIYIYHLKGNQRTSGEESRRQGGKVFGSGSRAPVAIVILVKNPDSAEHGKIYFHEVADYLSAEEKLDGLDKDVSVLETQMQILKPNARHSWLNQENEDFYRFYRMDGKRTDEQAIFENYSNGIKTNRDAWAYNSSTITLTQSVNQLISFYNSQVELAKKKLDFKPEMNPAKMKWDMSQLRDVTKGKFADSINPAKCVISEYRPFFKQKLYFDRYWNNSIYQMPSIFPTGKEENRLICVSGVGSQEFSVLMTGSITDVQFMMNGQCFPLYLYDRDPGQKSGDLFSEAGSSGKEGRRYAITDTALMRFRTQYQTDSITKEDIFYYIYGILHSEDYRKAFANNLMKDLPRIPLVPDLGTFRTFTDAGRSLADLHVNYESVEPYDGVKIEGEDSRNYRVEQLKYGKIPGKTGNAGKDKSVIVYNGSIVIRNIPLEAQEYVVNRKSALDWLVERIGVSVDKDSGIVNDFNKFAEEKGEPRYCLDLILRVITVSLETLRIVRSLPHIDFAQCK